MLARQTGLQQAHISNFLHRKRQLSTRAFDRILASLKLSIADLIAYDAAASRRIGLPQTMRSEPHPVPVVSPATAMHDPHIRPHLILDEINVPAALIGSLRARRSITQRTWLRFVAIRVSPLQAAAMHPVLAAHATLLLDRHYNSLAPYRPGQPSLYAVRSGNSMLLRYVSFDASRLILRPYSLGYPVELLELAPSQSPSDLLVGRACFLQTEL